VKLAITPWGYGQLVITPRGYDNINKLLPITLPRLCELEVVIATKPEVWDLVSFKIKNCISPFIALNLVVDVDACIVSSELVHELTEDGI